MSNWISTIQKILLVLAIAGLVGVGIYQAVEAYLNSELPNIETPQWDTSLEVNELSVSRC